MAERTYDQYCPVAQALDLVGERWTLLIARELLWGPQRYSDLRRALPGISTNLLAERLKSLEALGAIQRRELPPPAASTVYELTAVGRGLAPVIASLARWGMQFLPEPEFDAVEVARMLHGPGLLLEPDKALGVDLAVNVVVEGERFGVRVHDREVRVTPGGLDRAAAEAGVELRTLLALLLGELPFEPAVASGAIRVTGDAAAVRDLFAVIGLGSPSAAIPAPAG